MKNQASNLGTALEEQIAEKYRNLGFDVILEPAKNEYPFDLGNYQPDLLARKGEINYLIEVKQSFRHTPIDKFREIAQMLSQREGWNFLLETGDPVVPENLIEKDAEILSWNSIIEKLPKAAMLLQSKDYELACIYTWVLLEASLRNIARDASIPVLNSSTHSVINHLYSQGEISFEQFNSFITAQKMRNKIVHGYEAQGIDSTAMAILKETEEIVKTWGIDKRH